MASRHAMRRGQLRCPMPPARVVREVTAREIEVLQLVADGLAGGQIARRLWVSEETVKTHVANALDKLGATSRAHAVAIGIRRGLIT